MKQSTKRLMSSMLALALIVGAFVMLFLFIQPKYGNISRMRGEIQGLEDYVAQQQNVVQSIEGLLTNYESNEADREALKAVLPFEPDVATVIGQVNGLALMHGLAPQFYDASIESEKRRPVAQPARGTRSSAPERIELKAIYAVDLDVLLVGNYENTKAFLSDVETNIRLLDIMSIDLTTIDIDDALLYRVQLEVRAYYQKL